MAGNPFTNQEEVRILIRDENSQSGILRIFSKRSSCFLVNQTFFLSAFDRMLESLDKNSLEKG